MSYINNNGFVRNNGTINVRCGVGNVVGKNYHLYGMWINTDDPTNTAPGIVVNNSLITLTGELDDKTNQALKLTGFLVNYSNRKAIRYKDHLLLKMKTKNIILIKNLNF